jgi:zinc/manganese transport system permease protein
MSDALVFLAPAFAMCLLIASLHVYLGMHILAREIIFVDLSLAQLAALGATFAGVWEAEEGGLAVHLGALAFTAFGAAIFALARHARRHVSQEAIVGIVFAVGSALTLLVLSQLPHGDEHATEIMVGSLLVTGWERVGRTLAAYVVLGALQVALARRFIQLSWRPEEAERDSPRAVWWDLLFYLLFGIVIAISVQVAGVLLVFSFLIVPAVISAFFWSGMRARLCAGWAVCTVASVAGLTASWVWDLPTGAAIVAAFGLLLALAAAMRAVRGTPA